MLQNQGLYGDHISRRARSCGDIRSQHFQTRINITKELMSGYSYESVFDSLKAMREDRRSSKETYLALKSDKTHLRTAKRCDTV